LSTVSVSPDPVRSQSNTFLDMKLSHSLTVFDSTPATLTCQPFVSHSSPPLVVTASTSVSPTVQKFVDGYSGVISDIFLSYSVKAHVTFVRWQMYTFDLADRILEISVNLKNRP